MILAHLPCQAYITLFERHRALEVGEACESQGNQPREYMADST